jgi:hypothetical protein
MYLPLANIEGGDWKPVLLGALKQRSFHVDFMYGVRGSVEAYVVVGIRPGMHDTHISSTGLGSWLAQHFQWSKGRKNSYVPIMQAKSLAMLVIFIAHVASRRISVDAEDGFNGKSDVGSKVAAFTTEAMRISFERQIRQFAKNLHGQTRDTVKTRNRERMARFGFNPRYEVVDQLPYSGGNKMGYAVSCLFQVIWNAVLAFCYSPP